MRPVPGPVNQSVWSIFFVVDSIRDEAAQEGEMQHMLIKNDQLRPFHQCDDDDEC